MHDQNVERFRKAEEVSQLIRSRQTFKVLGDVESTVSLSKELAQNSDSIVSESIKTAGWAPFHYNRGVDGLAEPWRAYLIKHQTCRKIASSFFDWFDDVKPSNKLPAMLSACGALVLVTWIPQFRDPSESEASTESKEKQIVIDEEHLAATAAMVQNLLVILTAHGMGTYWSSGGQFRDSRMFEKLGINSNERLLAAVFVEYLESMDKPLDRLPGKQRANRCETSSWFREVSLDDHPSN